MLSIEIEYLTGVVRAASDSGAFADWPPQPDRLFSALVASWAARGADPNERLSLEWLERQPTPRVVASAASPRTVARVFTPPNDDAGTSITILPDRRSRQERRLPACIPEVSIVQMIWPSEPEVSVFERLAALAGDTSYLGHSASLVRCQAKRVAEPAGEIVARRSIYPGRLAELEHAFGAKRRPSPGAPVPQPIIAAPAKAPQSIFGSDWIVFSHSAGTRPDAVAGAIAAKTLLKIVQAGYGIGNAPPWVSGHAPDGSALATPHLAAVPLLDVGWTWSQGRLMGLALVLPRATEAAARRGRDPDATLIAPESKEAMEAEAGLLRALVQMNSNGSGRLELTLRLPGGVVWTIARQPDASAASLRPERYLGSARLWASVTPIALDRHPKAERDVELSIAAACERIGLAKPSKIVAGKHSAISAAVSAFVSARAPTWTGWRLPASLSGRRLSHATFEFTEPVTGPVILGAGRFAGLGLCIPLDGQRPP